MMLFTITHVISCMLFGFMSPFDYMNRMDEISLDVRTNWYPDFVREE